MSLIQPGLPCEDCGSSDAMAQYETNTYCFSCGMAHSTSGKSIVTRTPVAWDGKLPSDFTQQLSPALAQWFMVVNTPVDKRLGFSAKHDALIIPFYAGTKLIGYQIRRLQGEPKALNIGKKLPILFASGFKQLVIVEDIRSACKVAQHADVLCLMGTSLPIYQLVKYPEFYDRLCIWLDGDLAGRTAASKLFDKLKLCAIIKNIRTDKDPKHYSNSEILELIQPGESHD